jgi:hypothetical protein
MHVRSEELVELAPGVRGALGVLTDQVEARVARFVAERVVERLWRKDASLWHGDPKAIANRLGWLDVAGPMRERAAFLSRLGRDARRDGFERAVLVGMGGSSLFAEVLGLMFGHADDALPLTVLDSTVPSAVCAALGRDLERTLFVVASKSGTTAEVDALYRYVAERLPAKDRGERFVAITDPGTALDRLALEEGFRAVFSNPADIGGRFSALSLFGLVPAGLLGADTTRLVGSAGEMAAACRADPRRNPAAWLGAAIGEGGLAGRDKLTLVASPSLAPLGRWIEQLVAESTGKRGRGVLPVVDEPPRKPDEYGPDRLFVGLRLAEEPDAGVAALADEGNTVLDLVLPDLGALGGELLRWQLATALAGVVLDVDPFDEPDVNDGKDRTARLLRQLGHEGALPAPSPTAESQGVKLWADVGLRVQSDHPRDWLAAHFARAVEGDYAALLPYLDPTPAHCAMVEQMRMTLLESTGCATTVGWGPRFQHSTGQLFCGGPNTGVFLQITADDARDLDVPGAGWGLATLKQAQALGNLAALHDRGRRAVRVHRSGDVEKGLELLSRWLMEGGTVTTT